MSEELQPPQLKHHDHEDSGAHELESEDSSDDFVDASEGHRPSARSGGESPIPITRVEKVDDDPSYGEIPGTSAYKLRTADAVPDEIEVVPEGTRSRSASRVSRPSTPAGPQVPKIIAEKIDPDEPSYGDVPGTAAYELRKADAIPDEIVRSPDTGRAPANPWKHEGQASPTASTDRLDDDLDDDRIHLDEHDNPGGSTDEDEEDDDGFGDDFDEFAEGQEADADNDFGDFDEGFPQLPQPAPAPSLQSPLLPPQTSIPVPDFRHIDDFDALKSSCAPYIRALFPSYPPTTTSELPPPSQQIFLSERSVSLYTQLIAPPPLAPPNWLRSRIRRLFLVSLGVPVDLDEILPASKQKKLVLPSGLLNPRSSGLDSARPSTEGERKEGGQIGKLKAAHDSDASLGSAASGQPKKSRRRAVKEERRAPEFDVAAARRLAQTTQERIDGMSDEELAEHIKEVKRLNELGREYVGYWQLKVEEAGREKEAFEGVIENLVSFARKVRK